MNIRRSLSAVSLVLIAAVTFMSMVAPEASAIAQGVELTAAHQLCGYVNAERSHRGLRTVACTYNGTAQNGVESGSDVTDVWIPGVPDPGTAAVDFMISDVHRNILLYSDATTLDIGVKCMSATGQGTDMWIGANIDGGWNDTHNNAPGYVSSPGGARCPVTPPPTAPPATQPPPTVPPATQPPQTAPPASQRPAPYHPAPTPGPSGTAPKAPSTTSPVVSSHTTPDGAKVVTRRDGSTTTTAPNGTVTTVAKNGAKVIKSKDGTTTLVAIDGTKTVVFPDGRSEVIKASAASVTEPASSSASDHLTPVSGTVSSSTSALVWWLAGGVVIFAAVALVVWLLFMRNEPSVADAASNDVE